MNISIVASNGNVYAAWQNNDMIFEKLNFDSTADMVAPIVTVPNSLKIYGEIGSEQIIAFDVSATDNVGVVSGPTCVLYQTVPIQSGSTFIITGNSGGQIICSATDAEGNVGYGKLISTKVKTLTLHSHLNAPMISDNGLEIMQLR